MAFKPWTSDEDELFETIRSANICADDETMLAWIAAALIDTRSWDDVCDHYYTKKRASGAGSSFQSDEVPLPDDGNIDYTNLFFGGDTGNQEASMSHTTQVNKSSTSDGVLEMKTMSDQMTGDGRRWTFADDKEFERLIVKYYDCDHSTSCLLKIAQELADRRTYDEVCDHYKKLVSDIDSIERDLVPLPHYNDSEAANQAALTSHTHAKRSSAKEDVAKRKKTYRYWTEQEHRLFLLGVDKYQWGDWRSISRYYVKTRSPNQVASHAQKYKEKDRSTSSAPGKKRSILDITVVDDEYLNKLKQSKLLPPDEASDSPHPDAQNS